MRGLAKLKRPAVESIKRILDRDAAGNAPKIPGAMISIRNVRGDLLLNYATGKTVKGDQPDERRDLTVDDVSRIWSSGKLFMTIVALQLVEEGLLDLDDPQLVERHVPRLKRNKLFLGAEDSKDGSAKRTAIWGERTKPLTARMLLIHTGQLSQGGMDKLSREFLKPKYASGEKDPRTPYESFDESIDDIFFREEPGSHFFYSSGTEFMGLLLEALTGQNLEQLYWDRIFEPLGINHIWILHQEAQLPPPSVLWTFSIKGKDGSLTATPMNGTTNFGRQPNPDFKSFPETDKHAYGVSLCSVTNPETYTIVLTALLNGGVSPTTGNRILKAESVQLMRTPQLSSAQFDDHRVVSDDESPNSWARDLGHWDPEGNFGMCCAVQGKDRVFPGTFKSAAVKGKKGRKAGTAYWYGAGNGDWWCDWESGIAVMATSNFLRWNDPDWVGMMEEVEAAIYEGLESVSGS